MSDIDTKQALLASNGQTVRDGSKRWRIEARETNAIYPYRHTAFSCHAHDLDPKDDDEAHFCIIDLWQSESPLAERLLAQAVEIGRATMVDTGHEGIGSSRGTKRRYNPHVGTWTPVEISGR